MSDIKGIQEDYINTNSTKIEDINIVYEEYVVMNFAKERTIEQIRELKHLDQLQTDLVVASYT